MDRPPVCVLCTAPMPLLVDRHGRLAHCANCGGVADKYVELETTIIMMDILLMKPEAFRHWVYNSTVNTPPSGIRLAVLTTLFHVYISWAYHERDFLFSPGHCSLLVSLALRGRFPYVYFLSKSVLELFLFSFSLSYFVGSWLSFSPPENPLADHLLGADTVFVANIERHCEPSALMMSRSPSPSPTGASTTLLPPPALQGPQTPQAPRLSKLVLLDSHNHFSETFRVVSNTLLVSGIIKLFPIVMLIWPYDAPVLLATRLTVSLLHVFLLIEVINIIIPNKNAMFSYKTICSWLKRRKEGSQLRRSKSRASVGSFASNESLSMSRSVSRFRSRGNLLQRPHSQHQLPLVSEPPLCEPLEGSVAAPISGSLNKAPNETNNGDLNGSFIDIPALTLNFKPLNPPKDISIQLPSPPSPLPSFPNHTYWTVVCTVLSAQLLQMIVSHIIIIWFASATWNVTVRDVLFDDLRMANLIITGIGEVWNYASLSI